MNLAGRRAVKKALGKNSGYAAVFGILGFFIFALLLEEPLAALLPGVLCFALCIAISAALPVIKEKNRIAFVERDLPFALLSISMDLELNVPFEKCIFNAAKNGLATAGEFEAVFLEIKEKGRSVKEALLGFSSRNKSIAVKRAVLQLESVYEHGSSRNLEGKIKSSEAVRRIALELLAKQNSESRAFSGKLVVFSLLFIAVSAIVPALFQSFIIVGSTVLKMNFTPAQVFSAIVIGFPLADAVVLLYIRAKTPAFLKG
ncbi:MAG: hypothetical protein PHH08_03900 [Candidatus ainarchaeum sp.]|nr:hypothetical protein [Candidatus ainarchaeum sp.]